MRLKDKQTGEIGDYLIANHEKTKIVIVPNGKSPSEGIVFDTLSELCEHFEAAPEEKKYGGRVPKNGDKYWFISPGGPIIEDTWDDARWDHKKFEAGRAFWTYEEAEKEAKRRKAYVILKEDTKGFEPSGDQTDNCLAVYYSLYNHGLYVEHQHAWVTRGVPCFATRMDAEASIRNHRQEWLDYLGIEEEA